MPILRRKLLSRIAHFGFLSLLLPKWVYSFTSDLFNNKNYQDTLNKLTNGVSPKESHQIILDVRDSVADGESVEITASSKIPETIAIAILVEKNPIPLSLHCFFSRFTEPYISTRIKMEETSRIIALVQTKDQYYSFSKNVLVDFGGCED